MQRWKYLLLISAFFSSGWCALTYEVAWMRILDHVFGVSVFATTTVLATFMGGLALGAFIAGKWADRIRNPLVGYVCIELAVAAYAFLTPRIFTALEPLYGFAFRAFHGVPVLLTTARALLAVAALIFPASAMGATFPFMTRILLRNRVTAGRDLSLLYGANTLGGVAGCIASGFVLLAYLGTSRTIYVAGTLNVVVALAVLAALRALGNPPQTVALPAEPERETTKQSFELGTFLLVIAVAVSGFVSLGHEVVWFRAMLSYVYSSTYAFSLMLALFLFGIGAGGLLAATLPTQIRESTRAIGLITIATAASFWVSGLIYPHLNRYGYALIGLRLVDSWEKGLVLMTTQCALILLVPATLLGITFPATLHLLTKTRPDFASQLGRLYSLNTVAGIAGSVATGFLMIPAIGMRPTLMMLIVLQLVVGLAIVMVTLRLTARLLAGVVTLVLLLVLPPPPTRMFLNAIVPFPEANRVIFYRDGISDSTAVIENRKTGERVVAYSDGRGTAGTVLANTQKFLGHVSMLLHPSPREVLNIGFGVGNSMSAIITHDPDRLDCVELSEHVRLTAPYFWTNNGVLEDPRVHLIIEDGAIFMRHTDRRYDVIQLEPPELHVAGVVNLYTREFYEAARRRLKPGGLIQSWLTASLMPEHELKMALRTFMSVFPYTVVFTELESTTYLPVGSVTPIRLDLEVVRKWFDRPKVREHLRSVGIDSPAALLAFYVADQDLLWDYVGRDGPIITDDHTWVDFMIPRSGEAGYGFGPFKHPKSRDPFLKRVAEDWEVIDRLRKADGLSRWLLPPNRNALLSEVEERRALARTLRVRSLAQP
jgi:spermidine synthase